jgi:uncharacterized protein
MNWRKLLLGFILLPIGALADSPVWKVERDGYTIFIGGTIHVLAASDFPLPGAFDEAYRQAAQLVFETSMEGLEDPAVQLRLAHSMLYDDGRTLQSVLSEQTYARLTAYLAERGLPIQNLRPMRAGGVSMMLSLIELQRLGLAGTGVDEFFARAARRDGKALGQLETVDQQLAFLRDMGEGQEDALIDYTLNDLGRLAQMMSELKTAWRRGDDGALETVALIPMRAAFPALYRSLVVKRNEAWIPQLETLLRTREVELVLVGALHLIGPDGLIAALKARGYSVEQL